MSFVSITFLLFLPIVFGLHWLCRSGRQQNLVLILASYTFYAWWDWRFCGLMALSTMVDYGLGLALGKAERTWLRRLLVTTSVLANLSILGIFKYCNFFLDNATAALNQIGWQLDDLTLNVVLPVGISFYTFQTLSYTIDIYRRKLDPVSDIIAYLAFVSFFPQLVAGPIERASNLLPQFAPKRVFNHDDARSGLLLMLWGVAKKLLIADRLAVIVNETYGSYEFQSGPALGLATICFAFQIYCDFSAYSDIARGTARLFSIQLIRNFNYPYFATSLADFWRRWHISLSTWFRDYVYIPLGGNRCSSLLRKRNLLITFLLSGIWHGAAWTFVAWGLLHGLFVDVGNKGADQDVVPVKGFGDFLKRRLITFCRIGLTFTLVCIGWVFFRAESMGQAILILKQMALDVANLPAYEVLIEGILENKMMERSMLLLFLFIAFEWFQKTRDCPLECLYRFPLPLRWAAYSALIWGTLYLLPMTGSQKFIYFDF